jgi:hypothetical protein
VLECAKLMLLYLCMHDQWMLCLLGARKAYIIISRVGEERILGCVCMEEKTVRAIPAMPFAVITGVISAILWFIIAIIAVVVWIPTIAALPELGPLQGLFVGLGVATVIVLPIITFVLTFICAVVFAVLYNFLAPRIGGIKLQFEE